MTQIEFTLNQLSDKDDNTRHVVDPAAQLRAIHEWARGRAPLGYGSLGYDINRQLGEPWSGNWPFGRAADRLIQRMRKAGLVEISRSPRGWLLTDAGRAFLAQNPPVLGSSASPASKES